MIQQGCAPVQEPAVVADGFHQIEDAARVRFPDQIDGAGDVQIEGDHRWLIAQLLQRLLDGVHLVEQVLVVLGSVREDRVVQDDHAFVFFHALSLSRADSMICSMSCS